jgi:adenylate cyclase
VKIKLVLFIMDHQPWVFLGVLVFVGAMARAADLPAPARVVLVIACGVALHAFLHNSNPLTPWLRKRNDQVIFHACRSQDLSRFRRLYRWLPSDPRCRLCLVPFGGAGKLLRISPSRKNPNFCTDCLETAPVGTHEREVGILFADIRGFTAWSEKRAPAEVADGLTRFYALASHVLTRDDALVEFIGDQVMALYLPDFPSLGERTSEVMISAAERLLSEIDRQRAEDVLPVGVGIHIGVASVGNVGKGKTKDFTAIGDVVNTSSRLLSEG